MAEHPTGEQPSKTTTRLAALIAGGASLGLAASLWAPWYGADLGKAGIESQKLVKLLGTKTTVDAWKSFTYLDWLLAAVAVLGVALMITSLVAPQTRVARVVGALASTLGVAAAVMCVVRLIDPVGTGALIKSGAVLGTVCAAIVAGAATLAAGRPERSG